MSVGWQQSCPVATAQSTHGAVVRMCSSNEAMHVTMTAGHARRWSHCMTPQYMDSIIQTLQAVLNTTLLQSEEKRLETC